jgi:DNA polymerase III alpha subunit
MLYGEVEDPTGRIEVVVFPKVYSQYQNSFNVGQILVMDGRLDLRNNGLQFSINVLKTVSLDSMIANAKELGLYNEKEKISRKHKVLDAEAKQEKDPMEAGDLLYVSPDVETDEWKENPYLIEIKQADKVNLSKLKQLLLSYPGERKVELLIYGDNNLPTRIKLPMGINLKDNLENDIKALITI